jgi:CRP/FNR family transcriptional regulator, cyclic AMP receptor protein
LREAKLRAFDSGEVIIRQQATDTDIFFIIVGNVVLFKNDIEVERQGAGSVIGEIGAVDPGSYRSVTIKALEPTVVASVSQPRFQIIADQYPFLWKRLATEIADRLRRRGTGTFQPRRTKARVFIASSSESLIHAKKLSTLLQCESLTIDLWSTNVFQPSLTYIESLEAEVVNTDIAILLLSQDDIVTSRGITSEAPRDNLIFELGLFVGALSRRRTFIVQPDGVDLKIPSDLFGVEPVKYPRAGMSQIANNLKILFRGLGPR